MDSRDFERIYFECNIKPMFERVFREAENQIDTQNLPAITIEVNAEENNYFNTIQTAPTDDDKNSAIDALKAYYRNFFTQNYQGKSATNESTKIKVELVKSGIDHSLHQTKNYYLWPAIRYLSSIIKVASYDQEPSQHINDSETNRGSIAHIFYCKGDYTFESETGKGKETHILRISAVTFKKGPQNNFRHISKYEESQTIINAQLVSIEIQ